MHTITHDRNALADLSVDLALERDERHRRLNDRWEILEKQHQLATIISFALVNSRYYREIASEKGLSHLHGLAAFRELPFLSRPSYVANLEAIRVPARYLCFQDRTSGTSGSPVDVFRDSQSVLFESRRFDDIVKYYLGDVGKIGSRGVIVIYVSHYSTASEHIYHDPVLGAKVVKLCCDMGNIQDRVSSMGFKLEARSYVLSGTVSSQLHLATSEKANSGLPAPAIVLPSGEQLHSSARRLLEEQFRSPVYELCTFRECGTVAFQCRRGLGLHIQADWFVVEVLNDDGNPVPDGDTGELVVTDLTNYHLPLLRYTTGDFASIHWTKCGCGLFLPLLAGLLGRMPVYFTAANGRLVDTAEFAKRLERLPILWYRVTQHEDRGIEIEYCVLPQGISCDLGEFCKTLEDALELDRSPTSNLIALEKATQQGKTGGFISKIHS
jgi:phenylacetate-coenzyme A ligase PaaK-like adenylate-forming protein